MTASTIVEQKPNVIWEIDQSKGIRLEVDAQLSPEEWAEWDQFVPQNNLMLSSGYLKAIQSTLCGDKGIRFGRLFNGDVLIGAIPVQIIWAEGNSLEGNTEKENTWLQNVLQKILVKGDKLKFRILSIGNSFASGENGYCIIPGLSEDDQCTWFQKVLNVVANEVAEKEGRVRAFLVKDFKRDRDELKMMKKCGFAEFKVDPLMVMPINPAWENYDDYLQDLTSKFRTKAKAAFKKSKHLEWREMNANDIMDHVEKIEKLYYDVVNKSDFHLGHMNGETFADIKKELGDQFDFYGFFNEGELVGFQSGFRHGSLYDAHMIGVDYEHNKEWSLYSRILYQFVQLGIESGAERISYGRTAGEIKSTVGAFPVELSCCIRHVKPVPNIFLRSFFKFVKPKNYEFRYPYKAEVEVNVPK